jgi:hypothetical protein
MIYLIELAFLADCAGSRFCCASPGSSILTSGSMQGLADSGSLRGFFFSQIPQVDPLARITSID